MSARTWLGAGLLAVTLGAVPAMQDTPPKETRLQHDLSVARKSCPDAHVERDVDGTYSVYGCTPPATVMQCQEDEACWNCNTMGNHLCEPPRP